MAGRIKDVALASISLKPYHVILDLNGKLFKNIIKKD